MFVQSRGCCALLHSFSRSFRHNGLLDVRKVKYKVSYCVARSHILSLAKISLGDHNPFDFTIPLTTMIFIAFDHSKILNIKNLFPLTTGLRSSQRE